MLKNSINIALIVLLATGGAACKEKKKAALPTGELTETQKAELRAKALSNYKKLVEKYPDSENVDKAKARIQALSPAQGAKK